MKIPVDEAPAGSGMDAAVAEALGYKVEWKPWADGELCPVYLAGTYADEYDGWAEHEDWRQVLPYSTDIGAAWGLDDDDWRWQFIETPDRLVVMLFTSINAQIDAARRFPSSFPSDAIVIHQEWSDNKTDIYSLVRCRAFLKANGVEYVEVPE